jgi:pyruvate dehydrogenase (quinone)
MLRTTSDVLVERLIDWDVRVVFGLPGDGINGIMEALRTPCSRSPARPTGSTCL